MEIIKKSIYTKQLEDRLTKSEEENKKLKEERDLYKARNEELNENCFGLAKENKKLKETIKDHQLYEEKLEHRIIELEELLHGE